MNRDETSQNIWDRSQQAIIEETLANMQRAASVPFLWQRAQRVRKGFTPSEVVYEEDQLKLLHYLPGEKKLGGPPLLFVFALVNRSYILDLKPSKSVVSHFVNRGFDTYLLDWGTPVAADRHLTMDDYVNGYLLNVVDFLRERTGSDTVNVLGYCMGGTMSTMFTALHPEKVKNLILLAAGIDFATDALLKLWTDANVFDVDRFVDAFGNCPAEFLQGAFLMLKPVQNLIEKPISFFERLDDEEFIDDFFALEAWLNDNVPVPGEMFREFVKYLYQKNLLAQNAMPVGKHVVNLRDITCPVLNLMAENDHLVPCAQSRTFNDLVGSKDRESILFPAGHIGMAIGSKAQRDLWPRVCDWLQKRSVRAGAPVKANGRAGVGRRRSVRKR